jgi:gas vesicle protein
MNETKCFFYGLGLGVLTGVLMAPRSGVKTRRNLTRSAQEAQDYLNRETTELQDAFAAKAERAKRAAKVTADGIAVAFQAGREQLVG